MGCCHVRDLRTLTATGASSTTRRTLTGATVGALALLGALIGATGAYLAPHRLGTTPQPALAELRAHHRPDRHPSRRPGVPASRRPPPSPAGCWPDENRPPSPDSRSNEPHPLHPVGSDITAVSARAACCPRDTAEQPCSVAAADLCCRVMNFFTDPGCAHAWITAHPQVDGVVVTGDQAVRLGVDIFGRLLHD